MFGLGMPEILMILAIALIVIGPKKLPDLAKTLGRAMGEFKRSAQDFKQSLDVETTVKNVTDIEGITETIDTNDTSASELKDDKNSKVSDTDIKNDSVNDDLKDNLDDSVSTDTPETPLKSQNSKKNEDFNQPDNKPNHTSDTN